MIRLVRQALVEHAALMEVIARALGGGSNDKARRALHKAKDGPGSGAEKLHGR
jgi:hypothetical protein